MNGSGRSRPAKGLPRTTRHRRSFPGIGLGALSILLGVWADLGALMLVAFLVPTAVIFHGFWSQTDPQSRQGEMVHFQKDIALAGASLLLFVLLAEYDLGLTLTSSLF